MSLSKDSETDASESRHLEGHIRCGAWFLSSPDPDATVVNVSLSSLAVELQQRPFGDSVESRVASLLADFWRLMLPLNGWMVDRIGAKALYFVVFHGLHALLSVVRDGVVCEFPHRISNLSRHERRSTRTNGADDDGSRRGKAPGARPGLGRSGLSCWALPILGPVIAGAPYCNTLPKRWLFLINLPVGRAPKRWCWPFSSSPGDREENRPRDFALIGFALLSPGLVLFLYGSEHLGGGAAQGLMILLFSLVLLAVFIRTATKRGDGRAS